METNAKLLNLVGKIAVMIIRASLVVFICLLLSGCCKYIKCDCYIAPSSFEFQFNGYNPAELDTVIVLSRYDQIQQSDTFFLEEPFRIYLSENLGASMLIYSPDSSLKLNIHAFQFVYQTESDGCCNCPTLENVHFYLNDKLILQKEPFYIVNK